MRFLLGGLVLLFNLLDNATTFLCLQAATPSFEVFEANPVARFIFDHMGLFEGLMIETAITTAAVGFLVWTDRIPSTFKLVLLGVLATLPAWAALNNLSVAQAVGIPIPGFSA